MVGTPDLTQDTMAVYRGDLATAFRKLSALGYDGVELMTKDPRSWMAHRSKVCLPKTISQFVGFCTGQVFGEDGLGLVGTDPVVEEECDGAAQISSSILRQHILGAGRLSISGGSRGPGLADNAETIPRADGAAFRELADYAAPHGIEWILEPINVLQAQYIHTTQEGLAMVRRVNRPNFNLMLDVYHMNIEDVNIVR